MHPQNPLSGDPEAPGLDQLSSSGISSVTGSITSNNNNYATLPRKRNISPDGAYVPKYCYLPMISNILCRMQIISYPFRGSPLNSQFDEYEMEKIRRLMTHVDGDRRTSGSIVSSHRGSIDPSLMSSVFICVLILIFSISVYAFASLYSAVMKRMRDS